MSLVNSFTHLKGRPHEEKALPKLQRIASLVKPIMRSHSWTLSVLAEFFPENDSLVGLNINKGQKILLRLRPAWAPDTFYDDDQLVLVMLHELTHNVHGPHDEKFYALLGTLEKEYEALKRSGYAGEGFHSPGMRVGVGASHNLPPHLARERALAAAEKRRAVAALGGSGRLGGRVVRGKPPRELAAEAAERRARDEKSCASGRSAEAEIEAQRAAQDSVTHVIDVDAPGLPSTHDQTPSPEIVAVDVDTADSPSTHNKTPSPEIVAVDVDTADSPSTHNKTPSPEIVAVDYGSAGRSTQKKQVSTPSNKPATSSSLPRQLISPGFMDEWACSVCTLLNTPLTLQCAACYASRPTETWTCLMCGEPGMPHEFWTCRVCGCMKSQS